MKDTLSPEAQAAQVITQNINFFMAQNKLITDFFAKYENEVYHKEVAPGRNNGVYLLAHLIATNDGMLPLLGFGERLFPELVPLDKEPESSVPFKLSIASLKTQWGTLNQFLESKFRAMTVSEWLERHNSVSSEDFALDPLRNKLNILITRASHQNYHRAQLIFLAEKVALA